MHVFVLILLVLAAHYSLSAFFPSPAEHAHFYWPWTTDMHPILAGIGGLPQERNDVVTSALATTAGLCLLGSAAALQGIFIPPESFVPLATIGAVSSIVLFTLYLGPLSLIPIALDLIVLWGVVLQHWTVAGLRGS
jgi:hypothetical protein